MITKIYNNYFDKVKSIIDKIPTQTGSFGYDPWGYSPESALKGMFIAKLFYDYYFRVEAYGLNNIPSKGRILLISHHSGQIPTDAVLISIAVATNPNGPRAVRSMIERYSPTLPFIGNLLNDLGAVIGDPINCIKMLERDEAVIVFPEGIKGAVKHWKKRYQLQRFGTGFMRLALKTNSPIVPIAVIGCEETMPGLGSYDLLAKLIGVPKIPITIPFPLPVKVRLFFGQPMTFEGDSENEKELEPLVEKVKESISGMIKIGINSRTSVFF